MRLRKGLVSLTAALAVAGLLGSQPRRAGESFTRKMDGSLQGLTQGKVSVLVQLRSDAPAPPIDRVIYGGRVGNIITADLPAARLKALAAQPDVLRIERTASVSLCNDTATSAAIGVRGNAPGAIDTYSFAAAGGEILTITAYGEATNTTITVGGVAVPADTGPGTDDEFTTAVLPGGALAITVSCAGGLGNYLLVVRSTNSTFTAGQLTGGDILPANPTFYLGSRAAVARATDGINGSGVIIGFIDSGIDFQNADFLDALGNTRLLSIWDQTLSKQTDEFTPTAFAYGVEYTELQINNDLDSLLGGPPGTYVRQTDAGGHGTSVAGVAAGDGSNGAAFTGVAPGARLIMVKSTLDSKTVVDGLAYLKAQAASYNLPLVINLSIGTHDGPHDGTSLLDQAVDAAGGSGVAVVVAAGNSGFGPTGNGNEVAHDQMTRALFTAGNFVYNPIDTATSEANLATHLVISEMQAGPNGSQFVELYNPTNASIVMSAFRVDYLDTTGILTTLATFPAQTSIPPFGYYLVAPSGFVPAPDTVSTMMGGAGQSGGSISLIDNTGSTIDLLGYGGLATLFEGLAAPIPPNNQSLERRPLGASTSGNGTDTGDNSADFAVRVTPQPQNTSNSEVPGQPHIIDIWASDLYAVTVTDGTAAGTISAADGTSATIAPGAPARQYKIENRIDTPSNGATHVRITMFHAGPLAAVLFTITMTRVGGSGAGIVDAYTANNLGSFPLVPTIALNPDGSVPGTITEPATAGNIIAVGSFVSKFRWDAFGGGTTEKSTAAEASEGVDILGNPRQGNIHLSSSRGPTRDGRSKPDIAAPGFWIGSSRQAGSAPPAADIDLNSFYVYQAGTSFAAPQVAGIVALLFSKNAGFDQGTIKAYIQSTALNDGQTDNASNAWGAGKINATGLTGIVKSTTPRKAHNANCVIASAGGHSWLAAAALALIVLTILLRNRA